VKCGMDPVSPSPALVSRDNDATASIASRKLARARIGSAIPPAGTPGRFDRLGVWMRARPWRQALVIGAFAMVAFPTLMGAWIAIAYFRGATDEDAGAVALNVLAMPVLVLILFPLTHRAVYRWVWHVHRRRATTSQRAEQDLTYGSEKTEPTPYITWPWQLRARHALMYAAGAAALLFAFLPYNHQLQFTRFVAQHSVGSASAGSVSAILFVYLPIVALCGLAMLLTAGQMRRHKAGSLDKREALLLAAELNWLFAFAAAFTMTVLFCRLLGGAIVAYL
jgi:hypothetical protein